MLLVSFAGCYETKRNKHGCVCVRLCVLSNMKTFVLFLFGATNPCLLQAAAWVTLETTALKCQSTTDDVCQVARSAADGRATRPPPCPARHRGTLQLPTNVQIQCVILPTSTKMELDAGHSKIGGKFAIYTKRQNNSCACVNNNCPETKYNSSCIKTES